MPSLSLAHLSTPAFAWMQTYSHSNRRHLLSIASDIVETREALPASPGTLLRPAFACELRPLPSLHAEDMQARSQSIRDNMIAGRWTPTEENLPFLGATWCPYSPNYIRLATRRLADPFDGETYAEMQADDRPGSIPFILELLDPVTARP